jgi:FtsP/CotA-like multicopper oxidase with cupredoxin domain
MNVWPGAHRGRRFGTLSGLVAAAAVAALSSVGGDSLLITGGPVGPYICNAEAAAARLALLPLETNRNLSPAGQLRDGVLDLHLEIGDGKWHPEAEAGPSIPVRAFAEAGKPPQIPGPLIRVPAGTEVHATVRNILHQPAQVYGLHQHPSDNGGPIDIPAGETRKLQFRLTAPGTYDYWAATTADPSARGTDADSQLAGALIVDPPGQPVVDRVFVMGIWHKRGMQNIEQIAVINGKSWPYTERLTYQLGRPVHWRFINTTFVDHPTQLPAAHCRVTSEGNGEVNIARLPGGQRPAVTEPLLIGETSSIEPMLDHEGRWQFQCDMPVPMSARAGSREPLSVASSLPALGTHDFIPGSTGRFGVILGITVLPRANPYLAMPRRAG